MRSAALSTSVPFDPPEALAAFHAGDWATVRGVVEAAGQDGVGAASLALLAWSCHRLGDDAAADAAIDRALAQDGADLRALLIKADILTDRSASREAHLYYRGFLKAAENRSNLPPDLAQAVVRARSLRDRVSAGMYDHVREELARAGYVEGRSSTRFTHALDLATGRRQAYFQQPQAFFFPELPQAQFYPRDAFPWLDRIEAATGDMTRELEAVLAGDAGFEPYLRTQPHLPSRTDYPLIDSMDWSACFLWKDGRETANAARCPQTMAALADAPLCQVPGRSPQIMFSQLKARAHIQPHTGYVNTRLICHVPLIVPPGCKFRVGNEIRAWDAGKAWVFDDTIEHEAINTGDRTRVVLIFDIWRPELNEEERALVTTLLQAMDAFSPTLRAWD